MLIDHWRSGNTKIPMILVTPQRQSVDYAKRIRVIFAKEKAKYPADAQMHYGFILSEPFPWTEGSYQGEAILLTYRMTPSQHMFNNRHIILQGFKNAN